MATDGPGEGKQYRITDPCDRCEGAGELVVVEKDGTETTVTGAKAWDLIAEGDHEYAGTRECTKCNGFGRLNPGEANG